MTAATCEDRDVLRRLSFLYAGAFLILLAATWPLWLGLADFPQVPAFRALVSTPRAIDTALFAAAQLSAVTALVVLRPRAFWLIQTAFLIATSALNQHRFQVWAWHLCLAGVIATGSSPAGGLLRLRWLTIGVYTWSAISKFDVGFATGIGRTLWSGLLGAAHLDPAAIPEPLNRVAPWCMPAVELAAAIALAVPRTRTIGLALATTMHVLLLLAVGPLGLGHEWGVQLWNLLFLAQNVVLFRHRTDQTGPVKTVLGDRLVQSLLAFALLMPTFQPWGGWDVWPSWAVYSTRGGWTTVFVHHEDVEQLPESARPFVGEPPPLSDWRPIDIDTWSIRDLHCPVYPQPRFRLAIAAALSRHARIQVERRSAPHRLTGATSSFAIDVSNGKLPDAIEHEFWLNTTPR